MSDTQYAESEQADAKSEQVEWRPDDRQTLLIDDPILVKNMIKYMYTGNYSAPEIANITTTAADSSHDGPSEGTDLGLEPAEASNNFESSHPPQDHFGAGQTEMSQNSAVLSFHINIYALAETFQIHGLKALARSYFEHSLERCLNSVPFTRVVEEVYSATPANDRGLRDTVVSIALRHLLELRNSNSLPDDFLKGNGKESRYFTRDLCVAVIHRVEGASFGINAGWNWGMHGSFR